VLEPEQFDLPGTEAVISSSERAREEFRVDDTRPLSERTREFQRQCIEAAVEANDGNWAAAARHLGMHRSNLHHLARKLGLRG
jgi:transcriptional regulator with GAF, ATPase, and Fis domain